MVPGTDFSREYQGHVLPVGQGMRCPRALLRAGGSPLLAPSPTSWVVAWKPMSRPHPCPPGGPSPAGSPSHPDTFLLLQARMVAAATNNLCEAANAAVQGHASEEKLISSAKQVAASTAQLLVACKVKADHDSEAMKRLQVSPRLEKPSTRRVLHCFGPRLAACVRNPGLLSTRLGVAEPWGHSGLMVWLGNA